MKHSVQEYYDDPATLVEHSSRAANDDPMLIGTEVAAGTPDEITAAKCVFEN
jgi:hypothetical protein